MADKFFIARLTIENNERNDYECYKTECDSGRYCTDRKLWRDGANAFQGPVQSREGQYCRRVQDRKNECDSYAGNAKDICRARATGNEKVAGAELDSRNNPTVNASYKVQVARADADFAVARQKCDDRAGNVKDVCVKQAKAAEVAAKADATAQMKVLNANDKATDTSIKANATAYEKGVDARRDAASDKRDADYAVAREKCDAFASTAKSNCLSDAKVRFGKV